MLMCKGFSACQRPEVVEINPELSAMAGVGNLWPAGQCYAALSTSSEAPPSPVTSFLQAGTPVLTSNGIGLETRTEN